MFAENALKSYSAISAKHYYIIIKNTGEHDG